MSFRMVDIVMPDSTNHYGTLFAGNVMSLLVRGAFLAATEFAEESVVFAGADQVNCLTPIKEGSIIEITARIIHTGTSSITVKAEIHSKGPRFQETILAAEGHLNFVVVDKLGSPLPTKKYFPSGEVEEAEWLEAENLKRFRLDFAQKKKLSL